MDMNEILKEWDIIQNERFHEQKKNCNNSISNKKTNPPPCNTNIQMEKDNTKHINPMELWIRRYGIIDKDKIAEEQEFRSKQFDRNYIINMSPEAKLDLHGLHQNEAIERLNCFFTECIHKKFRKVLIIHGKGIHTKGTDPILGELVRRFIEQDKRCGMSGHPKTKAEGGTGATWVILKY